MARELTRKQKAFVQELVNNPKLPATKAAMRVYGKPDKEINYATGHAIASENMQKPAIRTELAKYSTEVEGTLYRAVTDWGTHDKPRQREIALDAAKYIHDKIHGKATQRVEQQSTSVEVHIDLTTPSDS